MAVDETELERIKTRFEALTEHSEVGVLTIDEESTIRYANDVVQTIFGYHPDTLVGKPLLTIMPERYHADHRRAVERYLRTGTKRLDWGGVELPGLHKEGHEVPLSISFGEASHEGSHRFTAVVLDITERKRRQETITRSNEQLRVLNRITRHDIRNDMNVVVGWAEELETHVDDAGKPMLDRILRTSQHVVDLTRTVREFVEALGTGDRPRLEPIDVGDILDVELAKRRAAYPDATFTLTSELPRVDVAANDLLSSVFRNILNNAVQHNDKETPLVEIELTTDPDNVTVRIADNGPGIPDEQRDAIFGRSADGLDDPAAGVGLYLVDQLVQGYDGRVWVEDNVPEGSVFVVELRRADHHSMTMERAANSGE